MLKKVTVIAFVCALLPTAACGKTVDDPANSSGMVIYTTQEQQENHEASTEDVSSTSLKTEPATTEAFSTEEGTYTEAATEISSEESTEVPTEKPTSLQPESATNEASSVEEGEDTTEVPTTEAPTVAPTEKPTDPPHAHKYDGGKITKEATCTANGVKTFTCSCGDSYSESIKALGHNFLFIRKVEPTYTSTGYDLYECSNCKATEKRNEVSKLVNEVKSITATVTNKTRYVGDTLTAADFTVTATYSDGTTKQISGWSASPLKLTSTSNIVTITYGGLSTTVTVTAVEKHTHSYTEDKSQYVAPTCTTKGKKVEVCACGSKVTEIAALGHNFVFTNKVPPTTTSEGFDLYTCNRCSATEQRNITAKLPGERTVVKTDAWISSNWIYGGVNNNIKDIAFVLYIEYNDGSIEFLESSEDKTSWKSNISSFNIDAGDKQSFTVTWKGQVFNLTAYANCGYSRKISVAIFNKIQAERKKRGLPLYTWNENLYQYVAARSYDWSQNLALAHGGNWISGTECLASNGLSFGQIKDINAAVEEISEDTFQQWMSSPKHAGALMATGEAFGAVGCFIDYYGEAHYAFIPTVYDPAELTKEYGLLAKYQKYIATAFSLGIIDHSEYPMRWDWKK